MMTREKDLEYLLNPNYSYQRLTIAQLSSLLSQHGIDLPSSKERKEVYVATYFKEIHTRQKYWLKKVTGSVEGSEPDGQRMTTTPAASNLAKASTKIPLRKSTLLPASASSAASALENNEEEVLKLKKKPLLSPLSMALALNEEEEENDIATATATTAAQDNTVELGGKRKINVLDSPIITANFPDAIPSVPVTSSTAYIEKRFKIEGEEEKNIAAAIAESNWSPKLTWKVGRPPTPMAIKARRNNSSTLGGRSFLASEQPIKSEAPKTNRFYIQPHLPGIRSTIISSPKSAEHLKPVKDLVARFDDGIPVKPSLTPVRVRFENQYQNDTDSTLSIMGDDEEEEEEEYLDEEAEEEVEGEGQLGYFEGQENFAKSSRRSKTTFFSLVQSFVLMACLGFVITIAFNFLMTPNYKFDFTRMMGDVEDSVVFAYRNPGAALENTLYWSLGLIDNLILSVKQFQTREFQQSVTKTSLEMPAHVSAAFAGVKESFKMTFERWSPIVNGWVDEVKSLNAKEFQGLVRTIFHDLIDEIKATGVALGKFCVSLVDHLVELIWTGRWFESMKTDFSSLLLAVEVKAPFLFEFASDLKKSFAFLGQVFLVARDDVVLLIKSTVTLALSNVEKFFMDLGLALMKVAWINAVATEISALYQSLMFSLASFYSQLVSMAESLLEKIATYIDSDVTTAISQYLSGKQVEGMAGEMLINRQGLLALTFAGGISILAVSVFIYML